MHLIEPLGFDISEKAIQKAGLDYWVHVDKQIHTSFDHFLRDNPSQEDSTYYISKSAQLGNTSLLDAQFFREGKVDQPLTLIFGNESQGMRMIVNHVEKVDSRYRVFIPMIDDRIRSYNLANSASMVLFEAYRQREKAMMNE